MVAIDGGIAQRQPSARKTPFMHATKGPKSLGRTREKKKRRGVVEKKIYTSKEKEKKREERKVAFFIFLSFYFFHEGDTRGFVRKNGRGVRLICDSRTLGNWNSSPGHTMTEII